MNSFLTETRGLRDRDILCKFTLVEIWKDRIGTCRSDESNCILFDLKSLLCSLINLIMLGLKGTSLPVLKKVLLNQFIRACAGGAGDDCGALRYSPLLTVKPIGISSSLLQKTLP